MKNGPGTACAVLTCICFLGMGPACTKKTGDSEVGQEQAQDRAANLANEQAPSPDKTPPVDAPQGKVPEPPMPDATPGQGGELERSAEMRMGAGKVGTGQTGTGAYDEPPLGASGSRGGQQQGASENGDSMNPSPNTEAITSGMGDKSFAVASLEPRSGSKATGQVTFMLVPDDVGPARGPTTETERAARENANKTGATTTLGGDQAVLMVAEFNNVPAGEHGFHIHEKGDCSAPDATSAGEHWNPASKPHAGHEDANRHAGDFGNVKVADDGKGRVTMRLPAVTGINLRSDLVGRAVVLHEKADDLKTQPSGNSGARIACGVIQATKAATH